MDEDGEKQTRRHYRSVTEDDRKREQKVLRLLEERFNDWQEEGYIPSRRIEPGNKTEEPMRTRGWTHWHHLFNPRQLLTLGLYQREARHLSGEETERVGNLLELGRLADTKGIGAKILRWNAHRSKEMHATIFSNQALNTLFNYCHRTLFSTSPVKEAAAPIPGDGAAEANDARDVNDQCHIRITDPPYVDAVNYHELSEFFLAWYEKPFQRLFPNWYTDSKRALAITGEGENFRRDTVDSYRNLAEHMPDDGAQIVMF
jgi:adenine-specific DNA methylase